MCVSVTKCCRTVRKNETRKENKKLVEGAERNDGGRSERDKRKSGKNVKMSVVPRSLKFWDLGGLPRLVV